MPAASACHTTVDSPVGPLLLAARDGALIGLRFLRHGQAPDPEVVGPPDAGAFAEVRRQLAEYFAGDRTTFDVPVRLDGTPFQRAVWEALTTIPYGATCTYADIAARVGRPGSVRAVGATNGRNPVPIIVPCHRVIGADGTLTGYGGGLDIKRALLDLEARQPALPWGTVAGA